MDMDGMIDDFQINHPKPMEQWGTEEVVAFILNEISMKNNELNYDHYLQRFKCISGYIFRTLTEESCKILSNSTYVGEIIYKAKETYIRCHLNESVENNNNYFHETTNGASPVFNEYDKSNENNDRDQSYSKSNRKPGRPRCKPISGRIGKRSEKLWEFLLHLLRDGKTCPHLIKWENFEEGTFKFVQSDKVARLWGNRKKNGNMTYEKFSRAMRYYYKSEVLLPVPGKRLVYKFGPHAKGWKNITPIF